MEFIDWSEIARASVAFQAGNSAPGTPFDEFRGKYLRLPDWFDLRADPLSNAEIPTVGDAWIGSVVRPDIWAPE